MFAGCAAFGVPATSDPAGKHRRAGMLFEDQQRSLPAERLIREALEYFERARAIYTAHDRFDALTNVDLNMGFTHLLANDRAAAYNAFDRARADSAEFPRRNPGTTAEVPQGFATVADYVAVHKRRAGWSIAPR